MLEATGRVEVVGLATDPAKGLKQIAAQPVDVLFLDIQMPGLSGFEVVERLAEAGAGTPMVVFTTAYDRHAVQAFEANALDYLLKPVEAARLDKALDRAVNRRATPESGQLRAALERLALHLRGAAGLDHLASRVGDRVQLVAVDQVTHVYARHKGTYAVTAAAEHLVDMTVAELEQRLDATRFIRIHRGIIVNLGWVAELRTDPDGHWHARLKDTRATELPVARERVRALKERLGLA
jgi:two-component system LytT family response regulator